MNPCPEIVHHWWQWHPSVGVAIGFLAGFGVVVPWLTGEVQSRGKKALWSCVMFVFVGIELWAIHRSEVEHDEDQRHAWCLQEQKFGQIANQLQNSVESNNQNFGTVMSEATKVFDQTSSAAISARNAVNDITGGDGFIYLAFYGGPDSLASIVKVGTTPLYNVDVSVVDCRGSFEHILPNEPVARRLGCFVLDSFGGKRLGDFPALKGPESGSWTLSLQELRGQRLPVRLFPTQDKVYLRASFSARNGNWTEYIWLRSYQAEFDAMGVHHKEERWEEAIKVYRLKYTKYGVLKKSRLLYSSTPSDFPQEIIRDNMSRY